MKNKQTPETKPPQNKNKWNKMQTKKSRQHLTKGKKIEQTPKKPQNPARDVLGRYK